MNYQEFDYNGIKIHLMHIADKLGWIATINGKDYGTYIEDANATTRSKEELDHFNVLCANAKQTIELTLNKSK